MPAMAARGTLSEGWLRHSSMRCVSGAQRLRLTARRMRFLSGQLPRSVVHELTLRLDGPWLEKSLGRSVMIRLTDELSATCEMLASELEGLGISDNERPRQCGLQEELDPKAVGGTG